LSTACIWTTLGKSFALKGGCTACATYTTQSLKARSAGSGPKNITVCAILFGLLPIMWSPVMQTGADVTKRIATSMIGGVITSAILELLIYPVIYVLWRKRRLVHKGGTETAG